MRFGQLLECTVRNHAENEARRLVPDLFLFAKNVSYEVKAYESLIQTWNKKAINNNVPYNAIIPGGQSP